MSDNGHGGSVERVAAALRPSVQPRTTADLSSRERSQLTDEMVALLKAQARQITVLTKRYDALTEQVDGLNAIAAKTIVEEACGTSLRARLRWLVRGC